MFAHSSRKIPSLLHLTNLIVQEILVLDKVARLKEKISGKIKINPWNKRHLIKK
jgi:hypothetical protein